MKLLISASLALVLTLASRPPVAAESNSLSAYTKQLIQLMDVFGKLNEAVAQRMQANERHLMAKAMYRLSGGFYELRGDKNRLTNMVRYAIERDDFHPDLYGSVQSIKYTLRCMKDRFGERGGRIGALLGIDGMRVIETLEGGLEGKSRSVAALVASIGLDPKSSNLSQRVLEDAEQAEAAARFLYTKSVEFARLLDPTAIPPEQPTRCHQPDSPQQGGQPKK